MMPFSSPPGDTQALSQFVYPPRALADDVEDEAAEGVWGYLIPLDARFGNALVLKRRENCSSPALEVISHRNGTSRTKRPKKNDSLGRAKEQIGSPGGYLIGRHSECGKLRWNIKHVS
jgi:serine/threonine-protein kinase Chk2